MLWCFSPGYGQDGVGESWARRAGPGRAGHGKARHGTETQSPPVLPAATAWTSWDGTGQVETRPCFSQASRLRRGTAGYCSMVASSMAAWTRGMKLRSGKMSFTCRDGLWCVDAVVIWNRSKELRRVLGCWLSSFKPRCGGLPGARIQRRLVPVIGTAWYYVVTSWRTAAKVPGLRVS